MAFMIISVLIPISSVFAANDFSGGLLDGKTLLTGASYDYFERSTLRLTDNNESTGEWFYPVGGTLSFASYTLSGPATITGIKINSTANFSVSFFNSSNVEIYKSTISQSDGTLVPVNVTGVSKVGFTNISQTGQTVNEFNVYGAIDAIPSTPLNLAATAGNSQVFLSWDSVQGATSYKVKRSLTQNGSYSLISSANSGTSYTDNSVTNGVKYFYVVSAFNSLGESFNSNEASATPTAPVTPPSFNRALLVITLVNGLENEYDLSMTEVNKFINWYNGRAEGTGSEVYAFNKTFNLANFLSRKDYIAFSKIETFEVSEYSVVTP
ncbi:fibronectin type III domain-containing protein [Paenibacillus qinlingensis]|nr:fibronectin type III domain-containing protein [Paenibacillus qinlingensis]